MDDDVHRFEMQAIGLAHHTLADGLYRNYSIDWTEALELMASTFDGPEAEAFAKTGTTPPNRATHTLDLAGAAYATAHVAVAIGNKALATKLLAYSNYSLNAFSTTTCLLKNHTEEYYEGTYMNYGFRPLTDMQSRIALCNSTDHFVELMDGFFGYGREAAVQLPILFIRRPK